MRSPFHKHDITLLGWDNDYVGYVVALNKNPNFLRYTVYYKTLCRMCQNYAKYVVAL